MKTIGRMAVYENAKIIKIEQRRVYFDSDHVIAQHVFEDIGKDDMPELIAAVGDIWILIYIVASHDGDIDKTFYMAIKPLRYITFPPMHEGNIGYLGQDYEDKKGFDWLHQI